MSLFVLTLTLMVAQSDGFGLRSLSRRIRQKQAQNGTRDSERFSNKASNSIDSWSKSAAGQKSSPLQVRKRVKAVLQKARSRTGVDIKSEANIVAEAASIGGLSDDILIEYKPDTNGKKDVANGSSVKPPTVFPDENMVVQKVNGEASTTEKTVKKPKDFDVVRGDVPAANVFCEPLPFKLPNLSDEQRKLLGKGERIQEQSRMGREGSGYVVLDVKAPPYVVWECLLDFESYPETIPTVRDMQLYTSEKLKTGYVNEKPVLPGTGRETRHYGTPSVTRAKFILSKFRLNIAAVHKYTPHPDGDYMIFTLDQSCTNMVLKGAKGIWYTEGNPDGREGYTRVFLLCELRVSRALPTFIVDYASDRAMPRATNWLKPQVEAAAELWLKQPIG